MPEGSDLTTISIYVPVADELAQVEERLRRVAKEGVGELAGMLDYVAGTGGKRVRPAITLLASRFYAKDFTLPIIMATAVELLHVATLIHDDTVDNSSLRRGKATVGSLWGRNAAVLLGRLRVCHICYLRLRYGQCAGHPTLFRDNHGPLER